ncbi:MAG: hypothetical protein GKR86_06760 [Ilumatobacter sp.]|nr:hypothetical protein [Ilumatobacter sp.]
MVEVNGAVAWGFERVEDVSHSNFVDFAALSAGFVLYADGEAQVDT